MTRKSHWIDSIGGLVFGAINRAMLLNTPPPAQDMQPVISPRRRTRSAPGMSERRDGLYQGIHHRPRWGRKLNGVI